MKKANKTIVGKTAESNIPILYTQSWEQTQNGIVYHFHDYESEASQERVPTVEYLYGIYPPFRGLFMVYFHEYSGVGKVNVYLDNIYSETRQIYKNRRLNNGNWAPCITDEVRNGYHLMTYDPEQQKLIIFSV